jgi:hypothetical protein
MRGLKVTPYNADFELEMKAFEKTRKQYRNAFRKLAQ